MLAEKDRPKLTFDMLQPDIHGRFTAVRAVRNFFRAEEFDLFMRMQQEGEYIGEEERQKVDRRVYDIVGEGTWNQAVELADRTVNYARDILFPNLDNSPSLLTNLTIGVRRPSSALERLTKPVEKHKDDEKPKVGQLKFEQGRQLALALLSAEVIRADGNGHSREIMESLNKILEEQFFIDKPGGNPTPYHTFSYHHHPSNRLVGLSHQFPDSAFEGDLLVKSLNFSVRTIGLRTNNGYTLPVPAIYEPDIKDPEPSVIKYMQRSLKATKSGNNGRVIVAAPHNKDALRFMLVVMEGGMPVRDMVASQLDALLDTIGQEVKIEPDNRLNEENGAPDRINIIRRNVKSSDYVRPIEVMMRHLEEYIASQYEVGDFDLNLGMHNGVAHILYKLGKGGVAEVAPYLWPPQLYKKYDLFNPTKLVPAIEGAKIIASKEYAKRLLGSQTIYPDPYAELGI